MADERRKIFLFAMSIWRFTVRRPCETVVRSEKRTGSLSVEREKTDMRVMIIIKATKDTEAGVMPSEQMLAEMGAYNEELAKAGIMLAGDGLHPTARGKRVVFSGSKRTVVDGPFAETKELLAGFWIWQVKSIDEAVEWVRRMPHPHFDAEDTNVEIRPLFDAADFGAEFTPELQQQEERIRNQIQQQQQQK